MPKDNNFIVWAFLVALVLVLVRPGSQGAGFVSAIGGAIVGLAQAVTGQKVTAKTVTG